MTRAGLAPPRGPTVPRGVEAVTVPLLGETVTDTDPTPGTGTVTVGPGLEGWVVGGWVVGGWVDGVTAGTVVAGTVTVGTVTGGMVMPGEEGTVVGVSVATGARVVGEPWPVEPAVVAWPVVGSVWAGEDTDGRLVVVAGLDAGTPPGADRAGDGTPVLGATTDDEPSTGEALLWAELHVLAPVLVLAPPEPAGVLVALVGAWARASVGMLTGEATGRGPTLGPGLAGEAPRGLGRAWPLAMTGPGPATRAAVVAAQQTAAAARDTAVVGRRADGRTARTPVEGVVTFS